MISKNNNKISHFMSLISKKVFQDSTNPQIKKNIENGRIPWSEGYKPYRYNILNEAVMSEAVLETFRNKEELPREWGYGLDERIVEYPWFLSRLDRGEGVILDAGSTLNFPYLLELPILSEKKIVIITLAPEHLEKRPNVSYLFGDLRDMLIRDNACDWIVSISTVEHIGMDNTRIYTEDERFKESNRESYMSAILEMKRVLKPGGRLFLTVPYGKYMNLGWLQQFDSHCVQSLKHRLEMKCSDETYYRYSQAGWELVDSEACKEIEYYDIHATPEPTPDRAAAARAVACLEFVK